MALIFSVAENELSAGEKCDPGCALYRALRTHVLDQQRCPRRWYMLEQ